MRVYCDLDISPAITPANSHYASRTSAVGNFISWKGQGLFIGSENRAWQSIAIYQIRAFGIGAPSISYRDGFGHFTR